MFRKSGETVHPVALNVFKDIFAVILFVPTFYIFDHQLFPPAPAKDYIVLLLSGVLGIGLADTLFFKCLNHIGAGLTAVIDCFYSPFVIGLSVIFLGERMGLLQLIGAAFIISAALTTAYRGGRGNLSGRGFLLGVLWGISAMALTALGIVMVKPILDRSPFLWVTEMRLIGGSFFLLLLLAFHRQRGRILATLNLAKSWRYTVSSSFLGAYLSMLIWLAGMKYTQASTAAVLNQTTNIFVFIFAALILKEQITIQRSIAIILAVSGAVLVILGQVRLP